MIKTIVFVLWGLFFATYAYCVEMAEIVGAFSEMHGTLNGVYEQTGLPTDELIAGLTLPGIAGGIIFACVGFISFAYGKNNADFKSIFIGIALMAYPYFIRDTIGVFVIGIGLTLALFLFRE